MPLDSSMAELGLGLTQYITVYLHWASNINSFLLDFSSSIYLNVYMNKSAVFVLKSLDCFIYVNIMLP